MQDNTPDAYEDVIKVVRVPNTVVTINDALLARLNRPVSIVGTAVKLV